MERTDLIDLTDIFDRLFRSLKKFWLLCILIVVSFTAFFEIRVFLNYVPTYTSSMTVIMTSQDDILVSNDETQQMMSSFQNALLSSSMQNVISEDLNSSYVPATLHVSLVPNTNFLIISATATNSEDAYRVVDSISRNYGQLTSLINNADMIVIDQPVISSMPDAQPSYLSIGIRGAAIGIIVSIIFITLYTLTRRTLTREDHIQKKLHLKCLTSIPFISTKKSSFKMKTQLLITNSRIPSSFQDAFQTLAMSMQRKKEKKVFMLTSALPNEGKSTVSLNVALTLAKERKKVILIDLDLRNPSLHRLLNAKEIPFQIGDYLNGKVPLNDVILKKHEQNIDFILGTRSYEHSISILSNANLESLFNQLKQIYDYIVVDVPPLLLMQDASIVSKYCDSSIIIIKQDYAKIYEIMDALEELYDVNHHILGCVLNSVKKSIFDENSRGYGYGSKYGK